MNIDWLSKNHPDLFRKLEMLFDGRNEEIRKLLNLIIAKYVETQKTKNVIKKTERKEKRRILRKINQIEETIEEKDEKKEDEKSKEKKQNKTSLKALIIQYINTYQQKNKGKNIVVRFSGLEIVWDKEPIDFTNIREKINNELSKILSLGGTIDRIIVLGSDYREYLNTAHINLKFEAIYYLDEMKNEENMWQFKTDEISLK